MSSLNDIVDVAESLEKSHIYVLTDSCMAVRNRNTRCRQCIDVCPAEAISIQKNTIELKTSRCVNCGLCTTVCPTEALIPLDPTDRQLDVELSKATKAYGVPVIACARMAAKQIANPQLFAQVPCLGHISESTLLKLFASGAQEVVLIDGGCANCKYHYTEEHVEGMVSTVLTLLEAQGVPATITRMSKFPQDMHVSEDDNVFGSTRRGFLSDTVKSAREMVTSAADTAIKKELDEWGLSGDQSIGKRLKVSEDGTLPQVSVPRHETILNSLFELGELHAGESVSADTSTGKDPIEVAASDTVIDTRLFGTIEIDTAKCNACGMCAVFCPTGAIKRDPMRKAPTARIELLEFSASSCVQCGLCQDVCWKNSITLRSSVSLSELFSFEPKVFHLK